MRYCHMCDYDPGRDDWLYNGVSKLNFEGGGFIRYHGSLNDFESTAVESFNGWSEKQRLME